MTHSALTKTNHECVIVFPFPIFAGDMSLCQIIFSEPCILIKIWDIST